MHALAVRVICCSWCVMYSNVIAIMVKVVSIQCVIIVILAGWGVEDVPCGVVDS